MGFFYGRVALYLTGEESRFRQVRHKKMENLGVAIMGEVPCVLIDVQRSGPSTGLATKPAQSDVMQIRWGRHGDQSLIALSPASVKECFDLTVQAFVFEVSDMNNERGYSR